MWFVAILCVLLVLPMMLQGHNNSNVYLVINIITELIKCVGKYRVIVRSIDFLFLLKGMDFT